MSSPFMSILYHKLFFVGMKELYGRKGTSSSGCDKADPDEKIRNNQIFVCLDNRQGDANQNQQGIHDSVTFLTMQPVLRPTLPFACC
jgi:hypothetical protein